MNTKVNKILIREKLDHGDLTEIAKVTGVHKNTVYHYFNGRTKKFNRKITEAAFQIIEKRYELHKKFADTLQNT
jgi:AcrR family transcriptional regulator